MPIEFRCPSCQRLLRVPDGTEGKPAACPGCGATVTIPGATPPPATAASPFAPGQLAAPPPFVPPAASSAPPRPAVAPSDWSAPPPVPETLNPYQSPLAVSTEAAVAFTVPPVRDGPAWEREGKSWRTLFRTLVEFYSSPVRFFLTLRREGGLGAPLGFGMAGTSLAYGVWIVLGLLLCGILGLIFLVGQTPNTPTVEEFFGVVGIGLGIVAVGMPLQMLVFVFVAAGLTHVTLLGLQGARFGFETTFRVIAYTTGACAPALALAVPLVLCCSYFSCVPYYVLTIVFSCIGIACAQEASGLKAAAAVLLPTFACCFTQVGLMVLLIALDSGGNW